MDSRIGCCSQPLDPEVEDAFPTTPKWPRLIALWVLADWWWVTVGCAPFLAWPSSLTSLLLRMCALRGVNSAGIDLYSALVPRIVSSSLDFSCELALALCVGLESWPWGRLEHFVCPCRPFRHPMKAARLPSGFLPCPFRTLGWWVMSLHGHVTPTADFCSSELRFWSALRLAIELFSAAKMDGD